MGIYGCDLSHWNDEKVFEKILNNEDYKFVILKATEGKTYFDPKYKTRAKQVLKHDKCLGFYHYARPENNSAKEEADNFLMRVKEFKGQCILALDWEGEALKSNRTSWIREWLERVEEAMGCKPLLYISQAECTTWYIDKEFSGKYPLWVAKWGDEPTSKQLGLWDKYTLWQQTNTPYDIDYFDGVEDDFELLYSSIAEQPDESEGSHWCGCCCSCCAKGKQE